jgi:hypothetical protein
LETKEVLILPSEEDEFSLILINNLWKSNSKEWVKKKHSHLELRK